MGIIGRVIENVRWIKLAKDMGQWWTFMSTMEETRVLLSQHSMLSPYEYLSSPQVRSCAIDMPESWNMFPVLCTREYKHLTGKAYNLGMNF
jgi:hypothetical protein